MFIVANDMVVNCTTLAVWVVVRESSTIETYVTDCASVLWVAWDPSVKFKFGAVKFWVEVEVWEDKIRVDCHFQSSLGRLSND